MIMCLTPEKSKGTIQLSRLRLCPKCAQNIENYRKRLFKGAGGLVFIKRKLRILKAFGILGFAPLIAQALHFSIEKAWPRH
jgi:hypothetical protein